jgi:hypothetical protein
MRYPGIKGIGQLDHLAVFFYSKATDFYLPSIQNFIVTPMSESYQSKRERRQRMLEALPSDLREHVSLRNVEAVAALPPQAQMRLLEAIQAGLARLPHAIKQLRADPQTSVADLLDPPAQLETKMPAQTDSSTIAQEVADLIQECFPTMPRVSAEALAEADVMLMVRAAAETHQQMFKSNHLKTDFVMLTLYGLMRKTLEQLEEMIEETPALRQAFEKTNEWRNE